MQNKSDAKSKIKYSMHYKSAVCHGQIADGWIEDGMRDRSMADMLSTSKQRGKEVTTVSTSAASKNRSEGYA